MGSKRWWRRPWPLAALIVVAALAAVVAWMTSGPRESRGAADGGSPARALVARRETRPTLDPARFVGKAARAYQVAREIPDVLDRLYCYCGCDRSVGHVSLLSCYTDGHAAT